VPYSHLSYTSAFRCNPHHISHLTLIAILLRDVTVTRGYYTLRWNTPFLLSLPASRSTLDFEYHVKGIMADPISVLGAVAGVIQIIDVLGKSISGLDNLRSQWQSSDLALLSLQAQLGALSAALTKIQEWTESGDEEIHHQLVMDLKISMDCCKVLASKVYEDISDLQKTKGGTLVLMAKARFMFRRNGLGELQSMIDRQTSALTLLLSACNRYVHGRGKLTFCPSYLSKNGHKIADADLSKQITRKPT
jgi:hypothetical protein